MSPQNEPEYQNLQGRGQMNDVSWCQLMCLAVPWGQGTTMTHEIPWMWVLMPWGHCGRSRSTTSSPAHNLSPGHPRPQMSSWEVRPPPLRALQGCEILLPGSFFAQSRHQMLIFSHEISLSDWFYHLFPSPWASVGWTSFILNFSAWDLLFCAAGSQLCKSLPTPSLPPDVVIGLFVFFHYFFQHRKLAL